MGLWGCKLVYIKHEIENDKWEDERVWIRLAGCTYSSLSWSQSTCSTSCFKKSVYSSILKMQMFNVQTAKMAQPAWTSSGPRGFWRTWEPTTSNLSDHIHKSPVPTSSDKTHRSIAVTLPLVTMINMWNGHISLWSAHNVPGPTAVNHWSKMDSLQPYGPQVGVFLACLWVLYFQLTNKR